MRTSEKDYRRLILPETYNYIACFLTLSCNIGCPYCINRFGSERRFTRSQMRGEQWVRALNSLVNLRDLPVTLQGGEPSLHPDFLYIINHIERRIPIDILTNLTFDVDAFMRAVDPARLRREAPYPSIRASYHPGVMDLDELVLKVSRMARAGFSIGVFCVDHPGSREEIAAAAQKCSAAGIDFRTKEFLGYHNGILYGTYRYPHAAGASSYKRCRCLTSELLIGPGGSVFRCHRDLYANTGALGHILDEDFKIRPAFIPCSHYGDCNPCDVKIKTNRHQVYGHTSVEIVDINDP